MPHKLNFRSTNIPIMLVSDSPDQHTGLARLGRDLASLLSCMPQFRVGYLGRGGMGGRRFPWASYNFHYTEQWGESHIKPAWEDFSEGDNGIIMSLWDASRMLWFGQPVGLPGHMQKFLGPDRTFEKWGYFPVDSNGINPQTLPLGMRAAVQGYDRTVAASEWGRYLLSHDSPGAEWIPHGIWTNVFKHTALAPVLNRTVVGCVMANQARKDWPVAFEIAANLKAKYGNNFMFWVHTDLEMNYWNIRALMAEYGMNDHTELTTSMSDQDLAFHYSNCACTILPSGGEGFGYPIAESLACGTACVVTNYAAGPELVNEDMRVWPFTYKIDTMHNVRRAINNASVEWIDRVVRQIELKQEDWTGRSAELRASVEHLDWNNLKHVWQKWFLAGVQQ